MKDTTKNYISAVIFLAFGIMILLVTRITVKVSGIAVIGPRDFPYFIGISMIFLSLVLLLQSINVNKKTSEVKISHFSSKDEIRVLLFILLAMAYIFLFNIIGFILSSIGIATLILLLFKEKRKISYVIVYISILITYFSFTKLLYVMLP